jgi:ribonucleotide reductase alpha subunit
VGGRKEVITVAKTRDALSVQQGQTRKGLQVRRLFTTDDAHPYDELTWERRDAVITNWRDGSTAFEQRDLEFPATWSQNATNIVAQKYFRGPLGTPQREHSVRQMIDRVAGTITDWGVKDGYFAGKTDAEAFRSELTHLLVNQRAAFNSPVWFNVGVEPHPQCSACFILSVEDTMPSILNWYVEEGLIFKGGSGSGINLSTIRSSKEALGNGGEASGPVSFMRGADSSAGTIKSGGKCFREGTLVATPSGMQPIERLRVGDQVLTHRGPRAVADFMRNGRRQCYRVLTREGYEVEVTAGHKFAYWNSVDGHFDVKPIEEFKPGDALYALLEPCTGGTTIPLLPPEIADPANATTTVEMSLPTELDERLAYVLGLMYGDGELRTEYPYRVRVSFAKDAAGRVSAQRFRDYSKGLFGEEPLLLGDASGHQQLGFTRKRLVQFLVANGIAKGKADALRFPSMLFRAEPDVRAAFIAGVIDADGSYQRRGGWNISSIDRAFLVDLQRLLMTLGVPAKIKLNRESNGTWRTLYRLHVVGHTFIQRLVEHIKPHSAKAQVTYEPSPGADKGWGYRPSLLRPLTSRVTQRGGYRLIERGVGMNETSGYGAVATLVRHPEAAVSGYAQELSTCLQLTLEAVTPTEVAETYDIEVEDVHLLSANGIYVSNTRRAAKMVVLNVNHPDVRDFIWCKAREEHKARVLRDAGFDMDLDGRDSISIQYQNANNSVRVTDDFMHAYESDGEFDLKAVLDGHTVERARARELMREIAQAAWECADPGMQYDTIINDWHTTPESGRINASNPCFTGEALVHTDKGLIRFDELARRAVAGETFGIYTHDATNPDAPTETVTLSRHDAVMVTGTNPIVRLTFSNGSQIRCTPNHRFWTANRGWVAAQDLESTDEIRLLDQETSATAADRRLPVSTDVAAYAGKGDHSAPMMLPEKWDPEFAHLLGWLVGDGSFSGNVISAIYGSAEDREAILPRHQGLFRNLNGGREPKISVQGNGTVQLRLSRRALAAFFEALGLKRVKAAEKDVPWSILQAPTEIVSAFLRGLFDADGTVVNGATTRYVGLASRSKSLLTSVQTLLAALGIGSQIYQIAQGGVAEFTYITKRGQSRSYESSPGYDLRIDGGGIDRFFALVGLDLPSKAKRLRELAVAAKRPQGRTAKLISRTDDGFARTYNLTEPKNHSYIVQGAIVANCSEYMHLDNSACNLASLNLLKFLGADGVFDVEAFRHGVEVMFLAQEIIVGNSSYPTEKITKNAKDYRQLGLGYANLGALLMAQGQPYDSDGGRAWAAAITALMTGHAYRTSARVAQVLGPFAGYAKNRTPMLRVMGKHRKAVDDIDASLVQPSLLEAARTAWDETIKFGTEHGFRNAQAVVIAPTGTIGLLMDCDTTGIEPDLALVKTKKLVGGGSMSIVNQTVPRALRQLGYADEHVQAILEYIAEHNSVKGAPALREEHYPVFDCAMGELPIHYMGHIRMMAAVQPFISGAISKCVTGETLIPTTDGLVRIGSLREDEPEDTFRDEILAVASLDGLQKTDAFYYGGVRPVREVVLRSGHRITGTPNHRLLVVTDQGLEWKELAEIVAGDHVAQQYGAELWSALPARFDGFNPSARYGNQKRIRIPSEMTEELSFLLGAFAAEGHITRTNHTIVITNSVEAVLQQVAAAWRSEFGVEARIARNPGKCPAVVISSKEIVEFLDYLGCGGRASEKRIPDAILRSPRAMVLSFLQGLALDAYVTSSGMAKWAICLDAPSLLDDLQAVLTNLGIIHSRVSKYNSTYDKSYDEVYAAGEQAQRLVELVPFREPDKVARARRLIGRTFAQSTAEVVPGISGPELYAAIPKGKPSRNGWSRRRGLAFLLDPRTRHVSRRTLERVAAIPGVQLPEWLRAVLRDNLHFSPVARVTDAGEREVFDLSVPAVQAFVGNGIVNHNTVNMPESASVEEVERAYYEGWKLGLKALAIYRDNCKVGQPLSATKSSKNSAAAGNTTDAADGKGDHRIVADTGAVLEVDNAPVRRRLPRTRPSKTTSFRVGDIEGYLTAGSYPDDGLGEIFVKVSKQGSTLSGVMDAFAIAVSMGLQYGVPLEVYVSKFSNMIFEPNGITDDPDIRITQSLVDYIARRLAIDYLDVESRQALGIKTTAERIEEVNGNGPSSSATGTDSQPAQGPTGDAAPADAGASAGNASQPAKGQPTGQVAAGQSIPDAEDEPTVAPASPRSELAFTPGMAAVDAPFCSTCGVRMRPAGSCFVCESCGTTSGCS